MRGVIRAIFMGHFHPSIALSVSLSWLPHVIIPPCFSRHVWHWNSEFAEKLLTRARVCMPTSTRPTDPPTHQSALSHNKWKMYRTWKHWMGMKFRLQPTHISLSLCLCFLWQCILQDFSFTFKLNLLSYIKVINSVDHTLVVHNAIRNERRREMLPLFHYRHFQIATVYMCVCCIWT